MQKDKPKGISLDPDTKVRLEILAALKGKKLKPYIEMRLKEISLEANGLINKNWLPENQSEVTEKTLKSKP